MEGLIAHRGAELVGRQELLTLGTPEPTETWRPVSHARIVEVLVESLALRGLSVVKDEYAITTDGMKMFGVLALNLENSGVQFAIGCRNSHDRSFALALTVGYRVFVCDNLAFHGDFTPVTRKHTSKFDEVEVIDLAVTRMQRHFEPMRRQIDVWRGFDLPDAQAKAVIYDAFVAGNLAVPRKLASRVHAFYFDPKHPEFEPRTMWSLSNAFTSAFGELDPVPRFRATARLAPFLARYD